MDEKLRFHHHKILLSVTLFVLLVIGILFGYYLSNDVQALIVMVFSVVFLCFVLLLITVSMVLRTRDEVHIMHEENKQQFQNLADAVQTTVAQTKPPEKPVKPATKR